MIGKQLTLHRHRLQGAFSVQYPTWPKSLASHRISRSTYVWWQAGRGCSGGGDDAPRASCAWRACHEQQPVLMADT